MSDAQFIALLVTTVIALGGGIVFQYLRGEKTIKRYTDLINDNHIKHSEVILKIGQEVTKAYSDASKSQEHLANAIDDLKMLVYNGKKK